jgi:hypothetical protein
MPLVSIDGLLYLTDERIYMQPMHPVTLGKSVINLKVANIKELFKRRYTLMDIGIEVVSYSYDKNKLKRKIMYLVFKSRQERDQVFNCLHNIVGEDCITTEKSVEFFT